MLSLAKCVSWMSLTRAFLWVQKTQVEFKMLEKNLQGQEAKGVVGGRRERKYKILFVR